MPHDRKNHPIKIGDIVSIPAVVTGVDRHPNYINIAVETIEPMFPAEHKTPLLLNARQVEVVNPVFLVSETPADPKPPEENHGT